MDKNDLPAPHNDKVSHLLRCIHTIDQLFDGVAEMQAWTPDDLVEQMKPLTPRERQIVLHYWDCRKNGCSHKLAEMLAMQTPPMSNTDREFLEGHCNGNQFDGGPVANEMGNRYAAMAKDSGVNVKGKIYLNSLARFPGDPQAWVSDRGDVSRVAAERNLAVEGSVNHTPDGRVDDQ